MIVGNDVGGFVGKGASVWVGAGGETVFGTGDTAVSSATTSTKGSAFSPPQPANKIMSKNNKNEICLNITPQKSKKHIKPISHNNLATTTRPIVIASLTLCLITKLLLETFKHTLSPFS